VLDDPGIESRWGARFYAPVQTGPGAHPASYTVGTGSFSGVESGRSVTLTPHPLLVPRSKKEWSYISLLSLKAIVACKMVKPTYSINFLCIFPWRLFVLSGPDSSVGISTGWTVRGSNPGGGEIFRTHPDWPWGPPSLLYSGYRVFPGGKAAGAWC
jgi:hypothetical protein